MEKSKPRIGLFLCNQGGRLAGAIDLNALAEKAGKDKAVGRSLVVDDPFRADFLDTARKDVEGGVLDRFLWVGRFSPHQMRSLKDALIPSGVNPFLHEWCDLEEQGVTLEAVDRKVRDRKALTLVRMAIARTRLLEPLEPEQIPASEALLILGGGVSGLHTAASVAALGKTVHLVEKESGLGGKVALLSRFYPRICDPHCGLEFVLDRLACSGRVSFHTLSELTSLEGSPGNFLASIRKRPRYVSEDRCNACGECVKVCPVEVSSAGPFSASQPQAETHTKGIRGLLSRTRKAIHPAEPLAFPTAFAVDREHCPPGCRECEKACPGKAVELDQSGTEEVLRVGAVLVATGWAPYPLSGVEEYGYGRLPNVVSNLEMERLLSMADQAPEAEPGLSLRGLKDIGFIQCAGSRDERHLPYCSSVCCSAALKQILDLKEKAPAANCHVFYMHIRTPGFEEELYRKARELGNVDFVKDRPARIDVNAHTGRLDITVLDPALDKKLGIELDLLVLAGGMCPSGESPVLAELLRMPRNAHGFFESHHQCFPEESQRTGIYVGGCAREPMNVAQSIESSHLAAMKALSFLQGNVTIEPTYPVLDKTKCDQCKRCMEDCPYGAFVFDEKGFPSHQLSRCRQCGNCMGVCPLAAISIRNNSIKQAAAAIQKLESSFMGPKEPLILAFLCENDAYKAARSAVDRGLAVPPNAVMIKVPCAGAVNNALVADALSIGVDGVVIAGCKDGQCHYVRGNQLVQKRSGDLREKLKSMRIEPERVRFENLEIRDSWKYVQILNAYIEELKKMGPNPFKM
ncbi:MAG: hydrogenase iron-sulfur subunit [Thermodesulfobacteriota bacterium]